jgi:hypothetical protein
MSTKENFKGHRWVPNISSRKLVGFIPSQAELRKEYEIQIRELKAKMSGEHNTEIRRAQVCVSMSCIFAQIILFAHRPKENAISLQAMPVGEKS